jgi:hypothetical protein
MSNGAFWAVQWQDVTEPWGWETLVLFPNAAEADIYLKRIEDTYKAVPSIRFRTTILAVHLKGDSMLIPKEL